MFFIKAFAFLKRDLQEQLSFKFQFLMQIFSIAAQTWVFFYLGKFIQISLGSGSNGEFDYFGFLLLGVAFSGYQFSGLNSFALALHKEIGQGTLESVLMTPTHPLTLIFANALWSFVAATIKVCGYLLIGTLCFGLQIKSMNFWALGFGFILTALSFSGLGLISAAFVLIYKRGDPVAYALNGLTRLFAGVYFPVTILPLWLQNISRFLPMTHALAFMRGLLLEGKTLPELRIYLVTLAGFAVLLLPLGLYVFQQAVQTAKRDGSLCYTD